MQPGMIHSLTQIPNDLEKEGGMSVSVVNGITGKLKGKAKFPHFLSGFRN